VINSGPNKEQTMLNISHLSKSYETVKAVDDVSLEIHKGEIFGFLGPNGAGKTTTISMIAGLLKPDGGSIVIDGLSLKKNARQVREFMGIVPQDMAFYEDLTAKENLVFWGRLHGLSAKKLSQRIDHYLEQTGLSGRANEALKKYSGGMKRRINLIIGLLHQPKLLLLDEPTAGIDVQTKLNIFNLIHEAARKGTTVLYTTHNLLEAEDLCDRIAIMDNGKILALGTLEELIKLVGEKDVVLITGTFGVDEAGEVMRDFEDAEVLSLKEGKIVLSLEASKTIPVLLGRFFKSGVGIDDITIRQPNLESVFLKLTGKELRE
jgi:ABC-2 type transport system ATP-binding protein